MTTTTTQGGRRAPRTDKTRNERQENLRKRDRAALDRFSLKHGFDNWAKMLKWIRTEYATAQEGK